MAWSFLTATKSARADTITSQIGVGGKLSIYTTAYASKLAEWVWTGNVWGAAVNGVLSPMNAPTTNPVTPLANGVATIARISKSDGTTFVISDLTVGTSASDVIISNTTIATNTPVSLNSMTITEAA